MHQDGAVELAEKLLNRGIIFGDDTVCMLGMVITDKGNRLIDVINRPRGNDCIEVFFTPILIRCGGHALWSCQTLGCVDFNTCSCQCC